jgi:hypothetical protein
MGLIHGVRHRQGEVSRALVGHLEKPDQQRLFVRHQRRDINRGSAEIGGAHVIILRPERHNHVVFVLGHAEHIEVHPAGDQGRLECGFQLREVAVPRLPGHPVMCH